TTALVGSLVVRGRPGNPVGPLMLWAPSGIAFWLLCTSYANLAFKGSRPDLPLAEFVAWLTLWVSIPAFALFIHLVLRFPSGDVPSPRWRWVSRLTTIGILCSVLGYGLRRGPIDTVRQLDNPLGTLAPGWVSELGIKSGDVLLPLVGVLSVVSLVVRFRSASIVERQQMKWFILTVSVFPFLFLLSQVVQFADDSEDEYLGFLLIVFALMLVPVSMGVGILKHRLYDVDIVVNRALVYATLTGILAITYLAAVVVLQGLLGPVTEESDLAVAGSTLAVAALFRPLRSRVQGFIDKRFYRRRYDAAATLSRFSTRLRDEIELRSLSHELVSVVSDTMQPAHASLWLRSQERPR
ncbi:MAG: hypothetical protein ACLGIB_09145, partial [Actinomycetota bacterium]